MRLIFKNGTFLQEGFSFLQQLLANEIVFVLSPAVDNFQGYWPEPLGCLCLGCFCQIERHGVRVGGRREIFQNLVPIPKWQLRVRILKSID